MPLIERQPNHFFKVCPFSPPLPPLHLPPCGCMDEGMGGKSPSKRLLWVRGAKGAAAYHSSLLAAASGAAVTARRRRRVSQRCLRPREKRLHRRERRARGQSNHGRDANIAAGGRAQKRREARRRERVVAAAVRAGDHCRDHGDQPLLEGQKGTGRRAGRGGRQGRSRSGPEGRPGTCQPAPGRRSRGRRGSRVESWRWERARAVKKGGRGGGTTEERTDRTLAALAQ